MENKVNIDTILFDLDGTLVDSRADIVDAVNHTLTSLGKKDKPFDVIVSYIGTGVKDLMEKSFETNESGLIDKAVGAFEEYYKAHSFDKTVLYPNVRDVLEYFRDKHKLIITNRKNYMAEKTLEAMGIREYFEQVIGEDGGDCVKPSSCPLDKGIAAGASDREKVLMVGDMYIDVRSGKNSGVKTCAVTYGIGRKEDILKEDPDIIIDDMIELKDAIR